jgi:cytochrome P450
MPRGPGWEQFNKIMFAQFVTQMDGEQHARVRRLLMPAFSSRRIEQLQDRITRIVDGMLDRIEANGPKFDGMQDYGAHLVVDALLDAMVNMDQRRKAIFVAFHDVIPGTTYVKPGESWSPELRRAFDRTMEEVRAIIEERRVSPRSDFISDLVNARDQGDKLSDSELFDQIFGICGASLSATSRAAGGALYLLYTHPEQLDQLIRNPALIPDALEECFRLASNGYFTFPRIATRDTEVGGTPILKGMVVRPSPLAPNYDPDVFPDPTRFDIHRKPKRILSFGAGPHHCIGNILGRTTITIAIRSLLARFPKAHHYRGRYYGKAQNQVRRLRAAYDEVLARYDLLLMPTMPMKAPPLPPNDAPLSLYLQRQSVLFFNDNSTTDAGSQNGAEDYSTTSARAAAVWLS